ncbi:putative aspartyl-tRNA synthetase [Lyophyllum shimeji]|uniref:Aspartyl-tRNA synthetase n=1 Tax=Lyophyllum shimeji TaxID=47721 RepID=A0A9P3PNQ7_LYOSH|nr:putative aspartyl-tRNA synthetase [Lyophyllum shimeji]
MHVPFTRDSSSDPKLGSEEDLRAEGDLDLDLAAPSPPQPTTTPQDKAAIADLVAKYGGPAATAWLEFDRYMIWRPSDPIPESSFPPVQGYMRHDPYVFAWGKPLVSDSAALLPTAKAFAAWAEAENVRPIWCVVDDEFQRVLASSPFEWSVVECVYEEVMDPAHVIDIIGTESEAARKEAASSVVKDLKKNLRRAEREDVQIKEMDLKQWPEEDKRAVEQGIVDWKNARTGVQIAATSGEPWVDTEHRRYWVARKDEKPVGLLILTPVHGNAWQIKNSISFPDAPRGTSEALIYTALSDIHRESGPDQPDASVSFGLTAAEEMNPTQNISGWKVTLLKSLYGKVTSAGGLLRRGEFRSKFDPELESIYVCYPQDGFGLHGVKALIRQLKK